MKISDIDIVGQIADLKDINYKNTLAITALIELFIEKGLFTRDDFIQQTKNLEQLTLAEITAKRRLKVLSTLKS